MQEAHANSQLGRRWEVKQAQQSVTAPGDEALNLVAREEKSLPTHQLVSLPADPATSPPACPHTNPPATNPPAHQPTSPPAHQSTALLGRLHPCHHGLMSGVNGNSYAWRRDNSNNCSVVEIQSLVQSFLTFMLDSHPTINSILGQHHNLILCYDMNQLCVFVCSFCASNQHDATAFLFQEFYVVLFYMAESIKNRLEKLQADNNYPGTKKLVKLASDVGIERRDVLNFLAKDVVAH